MDKEEKQLTSRQTASTQDARSRLPILAKDETLHFFFSFFPLLWYWPGKIPPSSISLRPFLRELTFQIAGYVIDSNLPIIIYITFAHSLRTLPNSTDLCKAFKMTLYFRPGDFLPTCAQNLTDDWIEGVNTVIPVNKPIP